MNDYRHTWTFDHDSRFIRAYCWLWAADKDNINFCKLWWGFWFAPLALILHGFLRIIDLLPSPTRTYVDRVESELEKPPNRFQRFLTGISQVTDRISAFWQRHDTLGFWLLLAAGTVALFGFVFWISAVLVYGTSFQIFDVFLITWLLFGRKTPSLKNTPFRFLETGYWSIKHRTCPRVVIRNEKSITE